MGELIVDFSSVSAQSDLRSLFRKTEITEKGVNFLSISDKQGGHNLALCQRKLGADQGRIKELLKQRQHSSLSDIRAESHASKGKIGL